MLRKNLVPSPPPAGPATPEAPYVLSYFALRKTVGWIAIALPFVVVTFIWFTDHCFQNSISAYYYTPMRDVFVGALCSIGIFLIACVGYKGDRIPSMFAGALSFIVAFSPTSIPMCDSSRYSCQTTATSLPFPHSNLIHAVAAVLLFLTLAYFCLVLFRRKDIIPTARKVVRNHVYLTCGLIILVTLATFGIAEFLQAFGLIETVRPRNLLFYVETICLLAFGFAWIVKGEQILGDLPPNG
jgi:hypothetical protein